MDFLSKLKDKKNEGMDPQYKKAKMNTLGALRDEMSGMMKNDLSGVKGGLKKVEVAGSSPEAVSEGLDTAKEMVSGEESGEDDASGLIKELVDHEASEGSLTAEKIDEIIQMLEQKKSEMSGGEMTPSLDKMVGNEGE